MRRIGFAVAWVVAISICAAQAQVAPAAGAQPGGRMSGGYAWPENLPAPVPLWANGAPGALGSSEEDTPTIAAFIPASNPTKTAVVVAPGGGYVHLSMIKEGARMWRAWLERAWGGCVRAAVPAGAEVSQSDRAERCEAGDADGAGRGGAVWDCARPHRDVGILGGGTLDRESGDDV